MNKETLFIAFSTQKGGVGKTTLTVLAASYLHYVKEAVSKARQPLFFCTLSDQKRVKKLAKIFGCSQDFSYICN